MKKFYLVRHEDVHNNSGTGIVAEGVIFDNGMGAMTWLTDEPTVTTFVRGVRGIKRLHTHGGKTEVIIEGVKKDAKLFDECIVKVREKKRELRREAEEAKKEKS